MMVVSGPSGVGKDAVLTRLRERQYPVHIVVTATTRAMRPTERDGVDYVFLDEATFERKVAEDGFLEWAMVYGNRYGVPKDQVSDALASGVDVIIKADVQGAETMKRLNPEAVFVFVAPPSMEELGAPSARPQERAHRRPEAPSGDSSTGDGAPADVRLRRRE